MDKPHLDPNTNLLYGRIRSKDWRIHEACSAATDAKSGMLRCPCSSCNNNKVIKEFDVWTHLYMKGFSRNYKVWYLHGKLVMNMVVLLANLSLLVNLSLILG
uniref:Transposase-associated domain-containing protein n=1 Tax=Brassica oleracea TaxID=3712 RepID=A0A3P6DYA1_BRAOL|nr:unnamed protein product [Brassica oleracea]